MSISVLTSHLMFLNIWRNRKLIKLPKSLAELADICKGEIIGNSYSLVDGICSVEKMVAKQLTFVASEKIAKKITFQDDVFYIVKPDWEDFVAHGICHENPQQAFRKILVELTQKNSSDDIALSAVVSSSAKLGKAVCVGENTVIGDDVILGDYCRIGCGVVIERNTHIGGKTHIGHRVVIHYDTKIGNSCVVSEGAVIAGQGFGFSFEGGYWQAIPQIGRVVIGDSVHIGSNTCIDRGAINDTIIGNNVIIDNLIHIAHNVEIGDGTAMAAGVGIAGSTKIGKHCLLAGQVGVVGHIAITDGVQINGGARVLRSIKESGLYAGSFHVQSVKKWNRMAVYLKKIEVLFKREKYNDK